MPFRSLKFDIDPARPRCVLTAGADDVAVQIRSRAFGGIQASSGFTFIVGGPELENGEGGFSCFSGEFDSEVEEGDEIWVAAEESAFQPSTPITVLVRSRKNGKSNEQPAETETVKTRPARDDWEPPRPVTKVTEPARKPARGQPAR